MNHTRCTSAQSPSTIFTNPLRPLREFLPDPDHFTVVVHDLPIDHWVDVVPNGQNPSTSREPSP